MSRKDYVAIAAEINKSMSIVRSGADAAIATDAVKRITFGIADVMVNDNPRFDYARFIAACGVRD